MKTFKWTEKQKKALRGSITKWTKISNGTGRDEGTDNCACCKQWYVNPGCEGCPISQFTGHDCCGNTPYENWCEFERLRNQPYTKEEKHTAGIFSNFLKALYLAGGGK